MTGYSRTLRWQMEAVTSPSRASTEHPRAPPGRYSWSIPTTEQLDLFNDKARVSALAEALGVPVPGRYVRQKGEEPDAFSVPPPAGDALPPRLSQGPDEGQGHAVSNVRDDGDHGHAPLVNTMAIILQNYP